VASRLTKLALISRTKTRYIGIGYPIARSANPAIFEYNYAAIRKANSIEIQCVAEYVNHPRFVAEFLSDHDIDELDDFEEWRLNRYVCVC